MFLRRLAYLLLCLAALALPVVPAGAAGAPWTAWLYNRDNGHMRLFNESGVVLEDFVIALGPDPAPGFPHNVAVSHGGTKMVYAHRYSDALTMHLYDVGTATVTPIYSMPASASTSLEYRAGDTNFNETETAVAFGYALPDGAWQVTAIDLAGGGAQGVSSFSPSAVALGVPANPLMLPVVQEYRGNEVFFTLIQTGTDGPPLGASYAWDTTTDSLSENVRYPTLDTDTFITGGDVVMSWADDRLPRNPDAFIFYQANALHVFDPDAEGHFPFYNDAVMSFYHPRFIEDAERIVVANDSADGRSYVSIIARDGTLVSYTEHTMTSVEGTTNGFIFTTQDPTITAPGTTALAYSETRFGIPATFGNVVWTSPVGEAPEIVWVSDNFPVGLETFTAWAQLAEPLTAASSSLPGATEVAAAPTATFTLPPPSATPTIPPPQPTATTQLITCPGFLPSRLVVGRQGRVTPGPSNNLRNAPNLQATLLGTIPGSATFNVLSGPVCGANGMAWWQVSYNGLTGYTAEGQGNTYWLEPLGSSNVGVNPPAGTTPSIPPPPGKTPSIPPPPGSGSTTLAVGGRAVVTQQGDNLRMRSGPGTTFPISRILDAGTLLNIIDGPRAADGMTWWRVQLVSESAAGGWVAQGSGTEVWLQAQ